MKVLHIWNTAGVGSLMAKSLRKNGFDCTVLMRKNYDPFGMTEYYGDKLLNVSGGSFIKESVSMAEDFDIIHVHGIARITEQLRTEYPNKKIVLQHHGTELSMADLNEVRQYYKHVDNIITSTIDLHLYLNDNLIGNTLIDNAVDTDLFKPIKRNKFIPALMFDVRYVNAEASLEFVRSVCDWDIRRIDRETNSVMYKDMPNLLNEYERYIDVKCYEWLNNKPGQAISKTGREALACGLEILTYKGEIIKGLPDKYTPEYQIKKLIDLYNR